MKAHLLVVEDHPLVPTLIEAQVADHFRVTLDLSGAEAWTRFRLAPFAFDAALLDWNLPGMAGLSLAHRLWSVHPTLPVVFISGNPDVRSLVPIASHIGFLAKPYQGDALVVTLRAAMAKSKVSPRH